METSDCDIGKASWLKFYSKKIEEASPDRNERRLTAQGETNLSRDLIFELTNIKRIYHECLLVLSVEECIVHYRSENFHSSTQSFHRKTFPLPGQRFDHPSSIVGFLTEIREIRDRAFSSEYKIWSIDYVSATDIP
jgi:hypothetical protein